MIESEYHTANYSEKIVDTWMFTNSTEVTLDYGLTRFGQTMTSVYYFGIIATFKSWELNYGYGFEVVFKCMSGFTTETGKFIMPVKEKLTYIDSFNRCDRLDSKFFL